jgi:hypothetical protein
MEGLAMWVKKTVVGALCVAAAMLMGGVASAQEGATLTLKSGERLSGQLVDLGGVGYTVQVNGQERQIPQNDVAAIDFTSNWVSDADWAKFNGTGQVVLRNGQTVDGQLSDIGGRTPLQLTFKTPTGDRRFSSSEVERVLLARPTNAVATTGTAAPSAGGTAITVPANTAWTPTGITVTKGQSLTFSATGDVQLSADANDVATASGSKNGRYTGRSALPKTLAGALIGRIGNSTPFGIGTQNTFQAPASGQLFLGVNDDSFGDNQGSFQVTIKK